MLGCSDVGWVGNQSASIYKVDYVFHPVSSWDVPLPRTLINEDYRPSIEVRSTDWAINRSSDGKGAIMTATIPTDDLSERRSAEARGAKLRGRVAFVTGGTRDGAGTGVCGSRGAAPSGAGATRCEALHGRTLRAPHAHRL